MQYDDTVVGKGDKSYVGTSLHPFYTGVPTTQVLLLGTSFLVFQLLEFRQVYIPLFFWCTKYTTQDRRYRTYQKLYLLTYMYSTLRYLRVGTYLSAGHFPTYSVLSLLQALMLLLCVYIDRGVHIPPLIKVASSQWQQQVVVPTRQ